MHHSIAYYCAKATNLMCIKPKSPQYIEPRILLRTVN